MEIPRCEYKEILNIILSLLQIAVNIDYNVSVLKFNLDFYFYIVQNRF